MHSYGLTLSLNVSDDKETYYKKGLCLIENVDTVLEYFLKIISKMYTKALTINLYNSLRTI